MTIMRRLLADRRRGVFWWSVGMVFGVAAIVGLWPSVRGNGDIEDVVKNLPEGVRAMIGSDVNIPLSSAAGYLQARLFATTIPIILLVYAIGLGARAIGGAEEDGTLQLVTVAPVTRLRIALERFLASSALLLWLVVVGVLTTFAIGAAVSIFDDVTVGRMLVDVAATTELSLLFLAIAFAVGAWTGRRSPAIAAASGVAVGTYVLQGITAAAPAIRELRVLSPWWWLLDRNLLVYDPTFLSVGLPLVLSAALCAVGIVAYRRRDLRFP